MSKSDKIKQMRNRLRLSNVHKWAEEFLTNLKNTKEIDKTTQQLLKFSQISQDYLKASHRLIALDYDGTLVPFTSTPDLAKPTPKVLELLKKLSLDLKNELIIISGRDRATLDEWFGRLDVGLVSEHGIWIKEKGYSWKLSRPLKNEWKKKALKILQRYVGVLEKSFIEEKEYALALHYRLSDPETSNKIVKALSWELTSFFQGENLQILDGNRVLEIKNSEINKGTAFHFLLSQADYDFTMYIGDDVTDESAFGMLPANGFSVKVGPLGKSNALYRVKNHSSVLALLNELAISEGFRGKTVIRPSENSIGV